LGKSRRKEKHFLKYLKQNLKKVTLFSVAATATAIMVAKEDFSAISKTYDERV
jgi:hypothetical protein